MSNATSLLAAALAPIDWKKNVDECVADVNVVQSLDETNLRLAIWSKQLEQAEKGNAALCFVRDMQISGQFTATCCALALYKPAAATMRTVVESALYYTFFRTHPVELSTLVRTSEFYLDKTEILEYHKIHTAKFSLFEQQLGLVQSLNEWYAEISGVVHGQLPGAWVTTDTLSKLQQKKETLVEVTKAFSKAGDLVHKLLLATVSQDLWSGFSSTAKQALTKGLAGEVRKKLRLDLA